MSAKTYLVVSALAIAAAGSAFARTANALPAEGTQDFANQVLSTKSRAEVVADLQAAQRAGRIHTLEASRAPAAASTESRTRVVAETREAERLGLIATSEVQPLPTLAQLERVQAAGERAVAMHTAAAR